MTLGLCPEIETVKESAVGRHEVHANTEKIWPQEKNIKQKIAPRHEGEAGALSFLAAWRRASAKGSSQSSF